MNFKKQDFFDIDYRDGFSTGLGGGRYAQGQFMISSLLLILRVSQW